jgi:hypothetical protein
MAITVTKAASMLSQLAMGTGMWVCMGAIEIAAISILINTNNLPITKMIKSNFEVFQIDFEFFNDITNQIVTFSESINESFSEEAEDLGIETSTFLFAATLFAVSIGGSVAVFLALIGVVKLLTVVFASSTILVSIKDFLFYESFFNLPVRLVIQNAFPFCFVAMLNI